MDRADYERVFADYLGVKEVIWLNRGIVGDDTHGHVDDLARFVIERTVVTVVEDNPTDANYGILQENLERLRAVPGLDVVTLPMPRALAFKGYGVDGALMIVPVEAANIGITAKSLGSRPPAHS